MSIVTRPTLGGSVFVQDTEPTAYVDLVPDQSLPGGVQNNRPSREVQTRRGQQVMMERLDEDNYIKLSKHLRNGGDASGSLSTYERRRDPSEECGDVMSEDQVVVSQVGGEPGEKACFAHALLHAVGLVGGAYLLSFVSHDYYFHMPVHSTGIRYHATYTERDHWSALRHSIQAQEHSRSPTVSTTTYCVQHM